MKNRFARAVFATLFISFLAISSPLTGNAFGNTPDECACNSGGEGTASVKCDGPCYAVCSAEGCGAACGRLPGSTRMSLTVNYQTVETTIQILNRPNGDKVSIRYFNESGRHAKVNFQYDFVTLLDVIEPMTQYGTIFINGVEINHLIKLKQSIKNNPAQPISLSLKKQSPFFVENFLSYLAGNKLSFTEKPTALISLEANHLPLARIIEQAGLK